MRGPPRPLEPREPRYFVTGGRQRPSHLLTREEWSAYDAAVLLELDTDSGAVRPVLEYASPPERTPRTPSHVFKAASWDGDRLLLCTQTEVVVFDPATEQVERTISHPWFNDLHHVARIDGRLHVVSTGLDCVLEVDDDGTVETLHPAVPGAPWGRLDRDTDFRQVATTKPHQSHPNYVLEGAGRRWVTRFEQRDVSPLQGGPGVRIADDPIHDGVVEGDIAWFTVVSGQVVAVDLARRRVVARHHLAELGDEGGRPMGWCRGIHREADHTLLAFSRLRPTTLKRNLQWLRKPLGKQPEAAPTRICAYDLEGGRKLQTWSLEGHGISSIFSVLPATPPG